jgi:hypothetical protein
MTEELTKPRELYEYDFGASTVYRCNSEGFRIGKYEQKEAVSMHASVLKDLPRSPIDPLAPVPSKRGILFEYDHDKESVWRCRCDDGTRVISYDTSAAYWDNAQVLSGGAGRLRLGEPKPKAAFGGRSGRSGRSGLATTTSKWATAVRLASCELFPGEFVPLGVGRKGARLLRRARAIYKPNRA